MLETSEIKKIAPAPAVFLPWATGADSLFCITLKIGRWKFHFTEAECNIMIAEALNDWAASPEPELAGVKITGYLISSTKLYLVLYHPEDFKLSLLDIFYGEIGKAIRDRHHHFKANTQVTVPEKEKNKKLFDVLPVNNDYVTLLITGRQVRIPYYNPHLAWLENYIQNHNFCSALDYSGAKGPVEVCLLQQYDRPFMYPVGINYRFPPHHTKRMRAQMDLLTCYFSLIKTFDCTKERSEEIEMNDSMQELIGFITRYKQRTLQLIMGANNNALARKEHQEDMHHEHERWIPGLMTHTAYANKWVRMIIHAFGDKEAVLKHLACICLGNEIDACPVEPGKKFKEYYEHWIPKAFTNLKNALAHAGLENVPVTTSIKNSAVDDGSHEAVSFIMSFINSQWPAAWNNNRPFVFFDRYIPGDGKSTSLAAVQKYFNGLQYRFQCRPLVYVGQTGYSSEYGPGKQAEVFEQLFRSLYDQYGNYSFKIPVAVFEAYDHKSKDADKRKMGLFEQVADGTCQLKDGIHIPAWIKEPI